MSEHDDAVRVLELRQVVCNSCGYHSSIIESKGGGSAATREWARVHRGSCPVRTKVRVE